MGVPTQACSRPALRRNSEFTGVAQKDDNKQEKYVKDVLRGVVRGLPDLLRLPSKLFAVPCSVRQNTRPERSFQLLNGINKLVHVEVELVGPIFESSRGEFKAMRIT